MILGIDVENGVVTLFWIDAFDGIPILGLNYVCLFVSRS